MKRKPKEQGFTFVEVLTVVIIIGILVGAGIPAYLWIKEDTRTQKKNQAIQTVEEAKIKFYNAEKTAAATVTHPTPTQLAYYISTPAGADPGIFYSTNPACIFPNVFPPNEVWYLNPGARAQKPEFTKIDRPERGGTETPEPDFPGGG
jgi:prepilin-type N-terminal cleavage/methylation domain-containing protein